MLPEPLLCDLLAKRYPCQVRIALCAESYPPLVSGVAVLVEALAQGAVAAGHEVLVVTPSQSGKAKTVRAGSLTVAYQPSVANPFPRGNRLSMPSLGAIRSVLRDFHPDVVHVHDWGACSQAGVSFANRKGIPSIGTYHFSPHLAAAYVPAANLLGNEYAAIIRAITVRFYNKCSVVVAPSKTTRDELAEEGVTRPLRAIGNGVVLSEPPNYHPWESVPVITSVGRIDPDKDLHLLVRAIPHVLAVRPCRFVFVGSGTALPALKRWVREAELSKVVSFVGSLSQAEVRSQLVASDAFWISSTVETQSIATIEALAAGLPIVVANAGALPELVEPAFGRAVDARDPHAFADALLELLAQDRVPMAKAARALAQTHDRSHALDEYFALYERAIQGNI